MSQGKEIYRHEAFGSVTCCYGQSAVSWRIAKNVGQVYIDHVVEDLPMGTKIKKTTIYEVIEDEAV